MRICSFFICFLVFCSCGTKPKQDMNSKNEFETIMKYTSDVNTNKKLTKQLFIADFKEDELFNNLDDYRYYAYYNKSNNELLHVSDVEALGKGTHEDYYFENHKLICVMLMKDQGALEVGSRATVKLIIPKNLSEDNSENQLYIERGQKLQHDFYFNHK